MTASEANFFDRCSKLYREVDKFAYHFAKGKLKGDPVFREIFSKGLIAPRSCVLDLGCGQGLLAAMLMSALDDKDSAYWPEHWASMPHDCMLRGVDLMPRNIARAQQAMSAYSERVQFERGDIRHIRFGNVDTIVLLDVMHYIQPLVQHDLLCRVRDALQPGGRLLMRVGDAAAGLSFTFSQWVDKAVLLARGQGLVPLHGRPLTEWLALLQQLGFDVEAMPLSQGTPFANVLLLASHKP